MYIHNSAAQELAIQYMLPSKVGGGNLTAFRAERTFPMSERTFHKVTASPAVGGGVAVADRVLHTSVASEVIVVHRSMDLAPVQAELVGRKLLDAAREVR